MTVRKPLTVLGIESSCDETAAAVVRGDPNGNREILSNVVLSQLDEHSPYGGVVPEIAARSHIEHLDGLIREAMEKAGIGFQELDGIAATAGPGLIGGVMVGLMTGKALAAATGKPFLAINHLEGHALSPRLSGDTAFPYLLLLVSGGHCQLLGVDGPGQYTRLGTTIDDAIGEAFDKTAKLMGLGYPGGPAVEKAAKDGDPRRFTFPKPLINRPGCDFSFSGLKTAVRQTLENLENPTQVDLNDICASFQYTCGEILRLKVGRAIDMFEAQGLSGQVRTLVVAGGVAANQSLRSVLQDLCASRHYHFAAPPMALCTDNGAMIAWAGLERLFRGESDALTVSARARWPLDPDAAPAAGAVGKA